MAKKSTSKLFQDEEVVTEDIAGAMNEPVEAPVEDEQLPAETEPEDAPVEDLQDIDLSIIKKKRFRINGDNSKILELNVSDMGIASRLRESYPRLNALMDEVADRFSKVSIGDDENGEESLAQISETVDAIDKKMRAEIDFIFNSNVSEVCGADGSMWDPIEGSFRYEHIIEKLTSLYENNLNQEFKKMKRRVANKTAKYANIKHK